MNYPDKSNPEFLRTKRIASRWRRTRRTRLVSWRTCRKLLLIPLLTLSFHSQVFAETASETVVKTAFLYNFFKFIEWPEPAANLNSRILCTTENDNLGDNLTVLQHKSIGDKPMLIARGVSGNSLEECHLVFISASENAVTIIQKLNGLPIVMVGEQPDFIDRGGTISLLQADNRLAFEINLAAAHKSGVHISAQLLKLAKRVITEK